MGLEYIGNIRGVLRDPFEEHLQVNVLSLAPPLNSNTCRRERKPGPYSYSRKLCVHDVSQSITDAKGLRRKAWARHSARMPGLVREHFQRTVVSDMQPSQSIAKEKKFRERFTISYLLEGISMMV